MIPDLYYCADSNARLADIATSAGFLYGARLPGTVKRPIHFADQNWKKPDQAAYIQALETHKPSVATVLDWERYDQFETVMAWAEQAAQTVDTVIIIPKVYDGIPMIPHTINGKAIRLGIPCGPAQCYSAAIWEYGDRPVHILGGQPHKQMALARYLNVKSVDCSVTVMMARKHMAYWTPTRHPHAKDRWWVQLQENGEGHLGKDAFYLAFERSCTNVQRGWRLWEQGFL